MRNEMELEVNAANEPLGMVIESKSDGSKENKQPVLKRKRNVAKEIFESRTVNAESNLPW